jgi:hypothetical protein
MRIYYGMSNDGKHLRASAIVPGSQQLTKSQRAVLCEVFAALCWQSELEHSPPIPPRQVGSYVRVSVGVDNGECFAEYIDRSTS